MLESKVVLITGGASGIGQATAKKLYEQGNVVIIADVKDLSIGFLKREYGEDKIYFYKCDTSSKSDVENLRTWIKENFGRLDYLVLSAGIMPLPCGIENITDDVMNKTIDVNIKGTFMCLKILGSLIKETSNEGSVVTLTSVDGLIGEPYGVIYSATKAAIISLTKSFARYYNDPIVRVNAVAPGLIDTPLTDSTGEDPSWTTDVSIIKRIGKAEEVANAIIFLLSNDSSFVTGHVLTVDGGFVLK